MIESRAQKCTSFKTDLHAFLDISNDAVEVSAVVAQGYIVSEQAAVRHLHIRQPGCTWQTLVCTAARHCALPVGHSRSLVYDPIRPSRRMAMLVGTIRGSAPLPSLRSCARVCHSQLPARRQPQQPFTVVADGRDGDPARRRFAANSRKGKSAWSHTVAVRFVSRLFFSNLDVNVNQANHTQRRIGGAGGLHGRAHLTTRRSGTATATVSWACSQTGKSWCMYSRMQHHVQLAAMPPCRNVHGSDAAFAAFVCPRPDAVSVTRPGLVMRFMPDLSIWRMHRAARTLLYYLMETNLNYHHWLSAFLKAYPIPRVS